MARLIIESGGEGKGFDVADGLTIGRREGCSIPLEDKTVSREHARISFDGSLYFIEDLGSTVGTFLNDTRIQKSEPLSHGDSVRVGRTVFRFHASLPARSPVALNLFLAATFGVVMVLSRFGFGWILNRVVA
jgi:pSer/pThr/pTyr-binding forkhead associated (FHA) protein